jgi:hypothetical protein
VAVVPLPCPVVAIVAPPCPVVPVDMPVAVEPPVVALEDDPPCPPVSGIVNSDPPHAIPRNKHAIWKTLMKWLLGARTPG